MKTLNDIGENKLIEIIRKFYRKNPSTVLGIGDDAALIKLSPEKYLVFTTDMLIENVHFVKNIATPYQIGWKSLGVSLSDIAAMGGVPKSVVLSLGLPKNTPVKFTKSLLKGINNLANKFGVDIVGGDTVYCPKKIVISITAIGEIEKENCILRSGAKISDKILVTGSLGGSRKRKQYNFIPRVNEARWLVKHNKIRSMIDITDGLVIDLYRIITSSCVSANLYKERIPISKDAKNINEALYNGEDFELLFTAKEKDVNNILKKWKFNNIPITVIGDVVSGKGKINLKSISGRTKTLKPKGYEHFKRR